jgi:heme exporter protein B
MLGLARAFIREKELETLDGIKLTPIGGGDILLGKILYNLVLMLLVQSLAFPMFILFFNFPVKGSVFVAFLFLTMGNIGFVVVGSAISVLVMNAKARELLLPVILFPILFPIIVSSILALQKVLVEGATIQSTAAEIKLIVAYTIMMGVIAFLTFDYALEE